MRVSFSHFHFSNAGLLYPIASEPPYGYTMYCCTHAYVWNIPRCLLAGSIGIGAGVNFLDRDGTDTAYHVV